MFRRAGFLKEREGINVALNESATRFPPDQCQVHHSTPMKLDLDLNILSISSTSGRLTTEPFHLLAEASKPRGKIECKNPPPFNYHRRRKRKDRHIVHCTLCLHTCIFIEFSAKNSSTTYYIILATFKRLIVN